MTTYKFLSVSHGCPACPDLINKFWKSGLPQVNCPTATLRRPTFSIEIPILLYRVAKGEWKLQRVDDSATVERRIYNDKKHAAKTVRAPYPDSIKV